MIFIPEQDETFPELGVGSVEGCEDQESVCSSTEREGDAFPKAFDRDLVTPNNLPKVQATEAGDASTPDPIKKSESDTKDKTTKNECKSNRWNWSGIGGNHFDLNSRN